MRITILYIAILVIIGVVIVGLRRDAPVQQAVQPSDESVSMQKQPETTEQSQTLGAVDVKISAVRLNPGDEAVFEIVLDTHSVNLEYNVAEISTLTEHKGKVHTAIGWTGGIGGHHLSGQLTFGPVSADAESVTLTISGIEGETSKTTWTVQ